MEGKVAKMMPVRNTRNGAAHVSKRLNGRRIVEIHILDLAVAAGGVAIVTHNVKHFDAAATFGVRVVKPAEMLRELR